MQKANRASFELSLKWQSQYARHNERFYAEKVDLWRDFFPGNMGQQISFLQLGERYREDFKAGELVQAFEHKRIKEFKESTLKIGRGGGPVPFRRGRFYPQGYAWRALHCSPQNIIPFRLAGKGDGVLIADTNHPLSQYPVTIEAKSMEKLAAPEERGGSSSDIADMLTANGPGMQVPIPGVDTDFYSTYPFQRINDEDDSLFYSSPRLVNHLDDMAIAQIKSMYSGLLSPRTKILDLMSSWVSHLPDNLKKCEVVGLGLNEEELHTNAQLSNIVVHDLNQKPILPFDDNEFDTVICTASIEYLTQPLEILSEVARVTKPKGIFVTTFSDRWFPGKEILPWSEMHEFERQGLVLDYYRKSGTFENFHTESVRGFPRPAGDRHIFERFTSDPVFAVWGNVKG